MDQTYFGIKPPWNLPNVYDLKEKNICSRFDQTHIRQTLQRLNLTMPMPNPLSLALYWC